MLKLAVALLTALIASAATAEDFRLDSLDLSLVKQDFGTAKANVSVMGNPISIGGVHFAHGVGTHAKSSLCLDLQSAAARFSAMVGVDDEMKGHPGSVEFHVIGDGKFLWKSGVMRVGDAPKKVEVDLTGVAMIELLVSDANDGIDSDHADWADAKVVASKSPRHFASAETFLCPIEVRPGWPDIRFDRSLDNDPLQIGDTRFATGIGTRANSDLIVNSLNAHYAQFDCRVGVDAHSKADPASVKFRVFVDNVQAYESPVMNAAMPAQSLSVPVSGARELRLVAEHVGKGPAAELVDWAAPELSISSTPSTSSIPSTLSTFLTSAPSILSRKAVETCLAGCTPEGVEEETKLDNGGIEIKRELVDSVQNHHCTVTERLIPAADHSIRWETTIEGHDGPWSTSIETRVHVPVTSKSRFWTAWSDPLHQSNEWHDPLVTIPFQDLVFWYGAPFFREDKPLVGYCPVIGDTFCIPMATFMDPEHDNGVSVILSPEDLLLDLVLATTKEGDVTFSRLNHRIGGSKPVHFAMDIVPHEADWRGGLRWMTERYPQFFNPINPKADEIVGCGAYSAYEGDLDIAKLKKMAFRLNWKASFDFPYMGMFLPPVSSENEQWTRFGGGTTSIKQMRNYAQRMRDAGFGVLSYFNVTELGTKLKGPEAVTMAPDDPKIWQSANDFLFGKIPDGVLYAATGKTWGTWGGAIAMDPAGPKYQAHLLDQARRHIDEIPAAYGICIDRMDWLRMFNPREDDGVSWRNSKPARSLFTSWQDIMNKLGPMMHDAGKVIFVNNHLKRLELLRDVDGIYCEFGQSGPAINSIAWLGVRKPVMAWTGHENDLKPDPDKFFQKYLYMGMFPTVPLPQNDHTILPSEWADAQYLRYGPLLDTLRGRKWVLAPHAIEVTGSDAKANLFQVPGGYIVPVVFGKDTAHVIIRNVKPLLSPKCEALCLGSDDWTPVKSETHGPVLELDVPLKSGCAIVKLEEQK